jgi:CHAT domain-containing protein/Tfp pilus assembly protein PilF
MSTHSFPATAQTSRKHPIRRLTGGVTLRGILANLLAIQLVLIACSIPVDARRLPQQNSDAQRAAALVAEGERLLKEVTGGMPAALAKFQEAMPLWQRTGDKRSQATTLNSIAKIQDALDQKQNALASFERALSLLRATGDASIEAATLNNIGLIYDGLGQKKKALQYYNQALSAARKVADKRTEAATLVNIGLSLDGRGEKQKTLTNYQMALSIFRALGDRNAEAVTLNNIGLVYHSIGEPQQAFNYFGRALPIVKAAENKRVEAITLNNIGFVYSEQDEYDKAIEYYERALPVLSHAGDRSMEAYTLNNIGLVHHSRGEYKKALELFTRALRLRQTAGDLSGKAETQGDAGRTYAALGETTKALESYEESLRLSRIIGNPRIEASTLRRIAMLEQKRGNLPAALERVTAAISIVESLRTKLVSRELRASYFATAQEHFETYISVLMALHAQQPSKGFDALALQASERGRARTMLEMLAEAHADIRQGINPALLERERTLDSSLSALAEKRARLLSEGAGQEQTSQLTKEVEWALLEYHQVQAEIRIASPRYASLTQPAPLSLGEIQRQALDPDTILLEYSLGEQKSYLWMVTSDSLKSYELPSRAEIDGVATFVYNLLTARNLKIRFETPEERQERVERADRDYEQAAALLSRMVLGPVAAQLSTKRLIIVGDGVLHYIPFAALPAPDMKAVSTATLSLLPPMMVNHEIVTLASASTLVALRREIEGRPPAPKTLMVLADPVFDKSDERVAHINGDRRTASREVSSIQRAHRYQESAPQAQSPISTLDRDPIDRLPFTRLEANKILSLIPPAQSRKALDFDANRATATSADLARYRYVHFATHGFLDPNHPELSSLVFSLVDRRGSAQDGSLFAHEVFNLRLSADLVVLSSCRTGLGRQIKGEGLVGLTRGFMYAGAARVIVSLWNVSDEASADLMAELYKGMLGREQLRPAAALRNAQLAVWKEKRWQAPYFWAGFVLQGEPK